VRGVAGDAPARSVASGWVRMVQRSGRGRTGSTCGAAKVRSCNVQLWADSGRRSRLGGEPSSPEGSGYGNARHGEAGRLHLEQGPRRGGVGVRVPQVGADDGAAGGHRAGRRREEHDRPARAGGRAAGQLEGSPRRQVGVERKREEPSAWVVDLDGHRRPGRWVVPVRLIAGAALGGAQPRNSGQHEDAGAVRKELATGCAHEEAVRERPARRGIEETNAERSDVGQPLRDDHESTAAA
jgi:hypothetical protein